MKPKRSFPAWISPLIGALFLSFIGIALFFATKEKPPSDESLVQIQRAVQRAAVQCFALEGAFPATLEYLEEHYHLMLDHNRYYVFYDTFGANIQPDVRVVPLEQEVGAP